jgi:hypothetical protein
MIFRPSREGNDAGTFSLEPLSTRPETSPSFLIQAWTGCQARERRYVVHMYIHTLVRKEEKVRVYRRNLHLPSWIFNTFLLHTPSFPFASSPHHPALMGRNSDLTMRQKQNTNQPRVSRRDDSSGGRMEVLPESGLVAGTSRPETKNPLAFLVSAVIMKMKANQSSATPFPSQVTQHFLFRSIMSVLH